MKSVVNYAHLLLGDVIKKNHIIVDATVGNGHDTLFLCQKAKFIYGFDCQSEAINNTKIRLQSHNITNYQLYNESFVKLIELVKHFDGVVFNLGYLPNSTSKLTTQSNDTIKILEKLLALKHRFFILMVVYPGHAEGKIESIEIVNFLNTHKIKYVKLTIENTTRNAPYIVFIDK